MQADLLDLDSKTKLRKVDVRRVFTCFRPERKSKGPKAPIATKNVPGRAAQVSSEEDDNRDMKPPGPAAILASEPVAATAALSERLWHERELLDDLYYALSVQHALLRSGEVRWAARSDDAVRTALTALDECAVLRSIDADAVARAHGLSIDATLADLARHADQPWATILLDHHAALLAATEQVDRVATETLAMVGDPAVVAPRPSVAASGDIIESAS